MLVWRRGVPISQALTLAANRSEQSDSPTEDASGDIFTNINVFESPPKQGWLTIDSKNISKNHGTSKAIFCPQHNGLKSENALRIS